MESDKFVRAALVAVVALIGFGLIGRSHAASFEPTGMDFKVESNLRAGVAKVDLTPAEIKDFKVTGHTRVVNGARDPLRAGILLLDDGETKAAIVTADTLFAWNEMVEAIRERLAQKVGVPKAHVMVAASHNHSGHDWDTNTDWPKMVVDRIGEAAAQAAREMRVVSIGYTEDKIDFSINRRQHYNGKAVVRLNPNGPNDQRVRVLRFDDGKSLTPLAVLFHATCHPCCFTWGDNVTQPYPKGFPKMSADFPGEAQTFIESVYSGKTKSLFLQGCAGDIRPNLPGHPYRCADEADIQWCGRSLGGAVIRALARGAIREERAQRAVHYQIRCATEKLILPGKESPVEAELQAMKVGPYVFLTMPGEPFVEYGFNLEKIIGDRATVITVGYANGHVGYIPTAEAFEFGGYEPGQTPLAPEAEQVLYRGLERLADRVIGDVFETFSKHDRDLERRQKEEAQKLKQSSK